MKRTKQDIILSNIFGCVWIFCWVGSIWFEIYRPQLFFTGLLAFVLGMIFCEGD